MSSPVIPIADLAHRITQQEAELKKLRQQFEAQQALLGKLTRRKEELQTQLRQVESEMQELGKSNPPAAPKPSEKATSATKPVAAAKPTPAKAGKKSTGGITLAQLLLNMVAQAGRPITVKELTQEAERRKYQTTSRNLGGLIENRVGELVKKGLLRRAKDQPGVVPAGAAASPTPAVKTNSHTPEKSPKTPLVAKNAATRNAAAEGKLTLNEVVTKVLSQSAKPLAARELAEKVLASGYQSKSKDFTNIIWGGISKMDNVENVPGQGYRLKKGK